MTKSALITGAAGQDGGHLAELLHEKGYEVHGTIRGQIEASHPRQEKLQAEFPFMNIIATDLTDAPSITRAVEESDPEEIYNLGAVSHVGFSFKNPSLTMAVTAGGVINLLEAIINTGRTETTKFYQASTSEMFGGLDYNRPETGYNEDAIFHPRSPYGVAKLAGHWMTRNYRESHKMYAASGILFNHEGERRGPEFVTRKVTLAAANIALGRQEVLQLGNMDAKRDWGYAGDYVEGMWRILQQDTDELKDYVLATGEAHSVRDFVEIAFKETGVDIEWSGTAEDEVGVDSATGTKRVVINPEYYRPAEVDTLLGDPTRAEQELGWKRNVSFSEMVKRMVANDLALSSK